MARLATATAVLALMVIVLGAYVRLSDAGLSCPDWPGCYGQISVPSSETEVAEAETAYPDTPVEHHKAWKEMAHRYLAGLLGLAIVALAVWSWRYRSRPQMPLVLPVSLVALVVFQALLGMWTVTLSLRPVVVTAHLLGGMATLALLSWLSLRHWALLRHWQLSPHTRPSRWLLAASVVVVAQLALGGWTSANYAALACPDFPLCNDALWPQMNAQEGFELRRELGVSEGATLISHEGLVAIHFVHRLGALMTVLVLAVAGGVALRSGIGASRFCAIAMLALLAVQVGLGIATVVNARPLVFAVAHNGNAALLLVAVVCMLFSSRYRPTTLIESRPT